MTDVSTTWAEVIFRVKWIVFVSRWCYTSGPLNVIGQYSHDGIVYVIFCSPVHSISCFVVKQLWLVDRNNITGTAGTLRRMLSMSFPKHWRVWLLLMNHYLFILDIDRILLCHLKVLLLQGSSLFHTNLSLFLSLKFSQFPRLFDSKCRRILKQWKLMKKNDLFRRSQYARILASKC